MKRLNYYLSLLFVLSSVTSYAYIPLSQEGRKWVYYDFTAKSERGVITYTFYPVVYEFKGDTIIDGNEYKMLWEDRTYLITWPQEQVQRTINVVAYVRDVDTWNQQGAWPFSEVHAIRANSRKPLIGKLSPSDNDYRTYVVYEFRFLDLHFSSNVRLTKSERDKLFTFTSKGTITINGTERICWNTEYPHRKVIEGLGYLVTDWDDITNFRNFIDLEPFQTPTNRILSHVIEDGEIIFKGERYDFIQENVYNPDKPIGENTAVEELPVATTWDGGTYYDLQGRAVATPIQPGIYIKDGQKVIVK